MGISIERDFDTLRINAVVENCFNDIAENGTDPALLASYVNVQKDCWLRIELDDELVGYTLLKPFNRSLLEIHPLLLPDMRKHSYTVMPEVLKFFDARVPQYSSLITNIPSCKRYATLFARAMGFIEVGRYKNGFEGEHDMIMFQRLRGAK